MTNLSTLLSNSYSGAQGTQGIQGLQGLSGVGTQGISGAQGIQGLIGLQGITGTGAQGISGAQGIQGLIGLQGITGAQGNIGGVPYTFSTSTTDADPGNGVIAYSSATMASIVRIFADDLDALGNTQTGWYDTFDDSTTLGDRGIITIRSSSSTGTVLNIFRVTGIIVATGYYKIAVTHISGTLPPNGTPVTMSFSRTGDAGTQGTQGIQGTQGLQGIQSLQGIQGPQGASGGGGGGSGITVGNTAPVSPSINDLWVDTNY